MINPVSYLFRRKPASFECHLTIVEARGRISLLFGRPRRTMVFGRPADEAFGGWVRGSTVLLGRIHGGTYGLPFPVFRGTFVSADQTTRLVGSYSPHWVSKVFFSVFWAACLYAGLATLFDAVVGRKPTVEALQLLGMVCLLVLMSAGLVLFAAVSADDDVSQIDKAIRRRLHHEGA